MVILKLFCMKILWIVSEVAMFPWKCVNMSLCQDHWRVRSYWIIGFVHACSTYCAFYICTTLSYLDRILGSQRHLTIVEIWSYIFWWVRIWSTSTFVWLLDTLISSCSCFHCILESWLKHDVSWHPLHDHQDIMKSFNLHIFPLPFWMFCHDVTYIVGIWYQVTNALNVSLLSIHCFSVS